MAGEAAAETLYTVNEEGKKKKKGGRSCGNRGM